MSNESSSSSEEASLLVSVSSNIVQGGFLTILILWTMLTNTLVFVILYKNVRLRTVPNLLVANLAFSDLCLSVLVLPLSATYSVTLRWPFGRVLCEVWLSCDILLSTSSIWSLSIIGLDRYWAVTKPVLYLSERTTRFAAKMIAAVWLLSIAISLAPFFGWKSFSKEGNYYESANRTMSTTQCGHFRDLPSFTVYSSIGSFWIPLALMYYVYARIYIAFREHRKRMTTRQEIIRRHLESTILQDIGTGLQNMNNPSESESDDSDDEEDEEKDDPGAEGETPNFSEESQGSEKRQKILIKICQSNSIEEEEVNNAKKSTTSAALTDPSRSSLSPIPSRNSSKSEPSPPGSARTSQPSGRNSFFTSMLRSFRSHQRAFVQSERIPLNRFLRRSARVRLEPCVQKDLDLRLSPTADLDDAAPPPSRPRSRKQRSKQPRAISEAKEKRGFKVLGVILGCFTFCWTPFFIMYLVVGFCRTCFEQLNPNIEMCITWLGYANSAMNPVIYTIFTRDFQNALIQLLKPGQAPQKKRLRRAKL